MNKAYVINDQSKAHFITSTVVDWIDVFSRKIYRDIIVDSLQYAMENKSLIVYGYVIMSNHIHLIIQAENEDLSAIIRDFKKFTAKKIIDKIKTEPESRKKWMLERFKKATKTHSRNKHYQFWQYGNHAVEIYSNEFLWSRLHYIHLNPVKVGIVHKAQDYIYSSASNYINGKGILNVTLADNPVVNVLDLSNIQKNLGYE